MATLNLIINVGGDDGYSNTPSTFNNSAVRALAGLIGTTTYYGFLRFSGVSGLSGATINTATLKIYGAAPVGTALLKVYAEKAEAPAAPTSKAEHDTDRTNGTTAKVDWDVAIVDNAYNTAPDLAAVIQEIIDAGHDPTAFNILIDDDGSAAGDFARWDTLEETGDNYATFDIDYTPAAVGGGPAEDDIKLRGYKRWAQVSFSGLTAEQIEELTGISADAPPNIHQIPNVHRIKR